MQSGLGAQKRKEKLRGGGGEKGPLKCRGRTPRTHKTLRKCAGAVRGGDKAWVEAEGDDGDVVVDWLKCLCVGGERGSRLRAHRCFTDLPQ